VRFGLTTPIVTLTPRSHAAWETTAGLLELRRIAEAADRHGFHYLTCSEHVGIPQGAAAVRGARYWDPLATFGYLAAVTERIRFATHVLVLPYHHPLEVAKRYGTLDLVTGGRVILGVGVGSLEEEFALLDVDFARRGPVFEDGLRALRAILGRREPVYEGSHYRIGGFVVDPCAVQERMPIWLGGRSARSLRRALLFGDGWDPFRYGIDELEELLPKAREWPAWRERREPFDVVLSPERPLDATTDAGRDEALATLMRYRDAGATAMNLRFRSTSCEHYLDQLQAFRDRIATQL
jgi:probable F420-dependent oxidoreductase